MAFNDLPQMEAPPIPGRWCPVNLPQEAAPELPRKVIILQRAKRAASLRGPAWGNSTVEFPQTPRWRADNEPWFEWAGEYIPTYQEFIDEEWDDP